MVKSNGPETFSIYVVVLTVFVTEDVPVIVMIYASGVALLDVEMVIVFAHDVCKGPSAHVPAGEKETEIEPAAGA